MNQLHLDWRGTQSPSWKSKEPTAYRFRQNLGFSISQADIAVYLKNSIIKNLV